MIHFKVSCHFAFSSHPDSFITEKQIKDRSGDRQNSDAQHPNDFVIGFTLGEENVEVQDANQEDVRQQEDGEEGAALFESVSEEGEEEENQKGKLDDNHQQDEEFLPDAILKKLLHKFLFYHVKEKAH